jgi:hypothetical protein
MPTHPQEPPPFQLSALPLPSNGTQILGASHALPNNYHALFIKITLDFFVSGG